MPGSSEIATRPLCLPSLDFCTRSPHYPFSGYWLNTREVVINFTGSGLVISHFVLVSTLATDFLPLLFPPPDVIPFSNPLPSSSKATSSFVTPPIGSYHAPPHRLPPTSLVPPEPVVCPPLAGLPSPCFVSSPVTEMPGHFILGPYPTHRP